MIIIAKLITHSKNCPKHVLSQLSELQNPVKFWGHRAREFQVWDSDPASLSILPYTIPTPVGTVCGIAFGAWRMCCTNSFEHLRDDSCMTGAHWGICWARITYELKAGMCESSCHSVYSEWQLDPLGTSWDCAASGWVGPGRWPLGFPGICPLCSEPAPHWCSLCLNENRQQWSWVSSVACGSLECRMRLVPSLLCPWCPGTVWFGIKIHRIMVFP